MTTGLLTPTHLLILLAIVLLLFGAKCLPETGRALGRSMREFKDALTRPWEASTNTQPASLRADPPGHRGTATLSRNSDA
jgi:sec-independent protein translocase protein TatA